MNCLLGSEGFRIGVERAGAEVVWSNQWEPADKNQIASQCYVARFGGDGHTNKDIREVLDDLERGDTTLPDADLIVGGFPCQDYSVARSNAQGILGSRGALWWEIHRACEIMRPRFLLLENVDRLLFSPASNKGADFSVMLESLAKLGYAVSWRVINAADYGFPQRRRRLFIFAEHNPDMTSRDSYAEILRDGVFANPFPVEPLGSARLKMSVDNRGSAQFCNAGEMLAGEITTVACRSVYDGVNQTLQDVLQRESEIEETYYVPENERLKWMYLKGSKMIHRERNGHRYRYTEGAMVFPDPIDRPSRTMLTSEGGASPSRTKHIIETPDGRLRRLTPIELERLNGFPDGWTAGVTPRQRAFLMGNAVVIGVVEATTRSIIVTKGG